MQRLRDCIHLNDLTNFVSNLEKVKDDINQGNDTDSRNWNLLHYACNEGRSEIVQILSQDPRIDVNARDLEGRAPIHLSSAERSSSFQILLADPRVDTHARDNLGKSILHFICESGMETNLVSYLASNRFDFLMVDLEDFSGNTPLSLACKAGNIRVVEMLLSTGFFLRTATAHVLQTTLGHLSRSISDLIVLYRNNKDMCINQLRGKNKWNQILSFSCCRNGNYHLLQEILSFYPETVQISTKAGSLHEIASNHSRKEFKELIENWSIFYPEISRRCFAIHHVRNCNHADFVTLFNEKPLDLFAIDDYGRSLVHLAAHSGNPDTLSFLINVFPSEVNRPDSLGKTPLDIICQNPDRHKSLERLIASPYLSVFTRNPNEVETLVCACKYGYNSAFKFLLSDPRIVLEDKYVSILILAFFYKRQEAIQILLKDNRVTPNYVDTHGRTILHYACMSGSDEIFDIAYSFGLDPSRVDNSGSNCLHLACSANFVHSVKKLILHSSIDINQRDKSGNSPLCIACQNNNIDIILEIIYSPGVDLNTRNSAGVTPLMMVIQNNNYTAVSWLVSNNKVDLNIVDNLQRTAFFIACEQDHPEIINLIASTHRPLNMKSLCTDKLIHPRSIQLKNSRWELGAGWKSYLDQLFSSPRVEFKNMSINDDDSILEYIKTVRPPITRLRIVSCKFLQDFLGSMYKYLAKSRLKYLEIIDCNLSSQVVSEIIEVIKHVTSLESLDLSGSLISSNDIILLLDALLVNVEEGKYHIRNIKIEERPLASHADRLSKVPKEIVMQGLHKTIEYIMDLTRSENGKRVYRTKIMVVGLQNVGKTALLDSLFPLYGSVLKKREGVSLSKYYPSVMHLQGKKLTYNDEKGKPKTYDMEDAKVSESESDICIHIASKKVIKFKDLSDKKEEWLSRLKKASKNESTHGIDIQTYSVMYGNIPVEVSVWDFAGQEEYYSNHYHFLTTRSVFLVAWNMQTGSKGIKELEFWIRSLMVHLKCSEEPPRDFSIMIVGTHLDCCDRDKIPNYRQEIDTLLSSIGFKTPISIVEVSSFNNENIPELQQLIESNVMRHSYMGEMVPQTYLDVEKAIKELRKSHESLPICEIEKISKFLVDLKVNIDSETLKRALKLLSLWGDCYYNDSSDYLSEVVVLNPKFLTKSVMAQLFNPANIQLIKNGILEHRKLQNIWSTYCNLLEYLLLLMEKFNVSFRLPHYGDEELPFLDQKSIIPSLLPEKELDYSGEIVANFDGVEVTRFLKFNVIPVELISRILVQMHDYIHKNLVWRNGVVLRKSNVTSLLKVEQETSSLMVICQAKSRLDAINNIELIFEYIQLTCDQYPGIELQQCAVSPHDSTFKTFIPLEGLLSSAPDFPCPKTKHLISPRDLLIKAGVVEVESLSHAKFINHFSTSLWTQHLGKEKRTQFFSKSINLSQSSEPDPIAVELKSILEAMGFTGKLTKAFSISNPVLTEYYEHQKDAFKTFRNEQSNMFNYDQLRSLVLNHYNKYVHKFKNSKWNNEESAIGVPAIHGTSHEAAWAIAETGFGAKPVKDEGYFGKGIYFTTNYNYAKMFAKSHEDGKVFVISLLLCGRVYPIIENPFGQHSFYGKPKKENFDSHYTLVQMNAKVNSCVPITSLEIKDHMVANELVMFDRGQTLPLFIIYTQ